MAADNEDQMAHELEKLQGEITALVKKIDTMKEEKADKPQIMEAVSEMKQVRAKAEDIRKKIEMPRKLELHKKGFDELMKRRFFFTPSFGLYGGVSGLYDLGPPGCAMKANTINLWRKHFIVAEGMYEVDTTSVTPANVLKVSGHVGKFSDLMTRDLGDDKCFRADHLVKDTLEELLQAKGVSEERKKELVKTQESLEDLAAEDLTNLIRELKIKAPETGNELSDVYPFNLMFATDIGPTGKFHGFLRPETAQGIFMNFARLLEANGGRLPFAGACVGQAFRNEISPRAGLLRVLEFTLCEIEHFVHPEDNTHPKFADIADISVLLYSRDRQENAPQRGQRMTIGQAFETGLIINQNVGYFMGRIALFAKRVGLKEEKYRFRQHREKEMAHYAKDCWDLEALTTYGWVECIGIADRSCFDLSVHAAATNAKLHVFQPYDKVLHVKKLVAEPVKGLIGKTFKKDGKQIMSSLAALGDEAVTALRAEMESGKATVKVGEAEFSLEPKMVNFKEVTEKVTGKNITPSVIEPSFGIGRLLYSIWEQSYYVREGDEQRGVLSLSQMVAPITCLVLPLMVKDELIIPTRDVVKRLATAGISHSEDSSGAAVGRRYARADEIGVPYGVTVDYITVSDSTVTLRERDTMHQIRIKIDEVCPLLNDLVGGRTTWAEVYDKYPHEQVKED